MFQFGVLKQPLKQFLSVWTVMSFSKSGGFLIMATFWDPPRLRPGSCETSCGRLPNNRSTNIPHENVGFPCFQNGCSRNSFCLSLGISHVKIESSIFLNPQNLFKSCSLAFGVEEMFQTKARRHRGTVSKEHAFAYPTPCWCESACFTAGERTDVPPAFRVSPFFKGNA